MGLGYAISPTGADHCHNIHDNLFSSPGPRFESVQALGILEPLPIDDLSPAKVRLLIYSLYWAHFLDCLVFCSFVPLDYEQMNQLVRAVTGWNTTTWELMKVGERVMAMTRLFNLREGIGRETDRLPQRFFTPFESGPLKGVGIDQRDFEIALDNFYLMMGWDKERGMPTLSKLQELDIEWAADLLSGEP
jgi:aldehyde:ferredoxin oxidoreductase